MSAARRKIWIECPCGAKRLAEFAPADAADVERIVRAPCAICGNAGEGRIYLLVPQRNLKLVRP